MSTETEPVGIVSGLCRKCEEGLALMFVIYLGEDLDPIAKRVNESHRQQNREHPAERLEMLRQTIHDRREWCAEHRSDR